MEGLGEDGFSILPILYYPVIDGCRVTTQLTPESGMHGVLSLLCTIFPTNFLLFLAEMFFAVMEMKLGNETRLSRIRWQ